jgi:general secretion pathway protein A
MTTAISINNAEYLTHFGLLRNPFPVAPDDANFYLSDTIEEIVAEIVHGVCARKGFITLTGDVGLGKTTITRRILKILESKQVNTSLVFHTSLKDVDLLREINRDFGIPVEVTSDCDQLGNQLQRLNEFLVSQHGQGGNCAIIIDDAQNLDRDSLELVRMISNLEVDQQKIVQILLVGQTELMITLKSRTMRQLNSRIVIRKVVRSLSHMELRSYIQFKLNMAGNQGRITLTPFAYWRLYRHSKGNFRSVNMLLDRCLYAICLGGGYRITRRTVNAAVSDLNSERGYTRKRSLAWAASLLIPIMIAIGSWGGHFTFSRKVMANTSAKTTIHKVPADQGQAALVTHSKNVVSVGAAKYDGNLVSKLNPAVTTFLGIYQLEHFADDFQQAINKGTLSSLSQRIYGETGLQLIRLSSVPDYIRKRYGALAFSLNRDESPEWLLFWKPQLELRRFYYDYRGEEIFTLQKKLQDLNFYHYNLDGIVGHRLMNAVVTFQKSAGLPITGFPDPATLFWVCHLHRTEVSNG